MYDIVNIFENHCLVEAAWMPSVPAFFYCRSDIEFVYRYEIRPVPGHPGYLVTNDGHVLSMWNGSSRGGWFIGDTIREIGAVGGTGYKYVTLRNGKSSTVHRLVAEVFLPRPVGATQVRHLDGNKLNCHVDNLRWGTAKENAADKLLHGTHRQGSMMEAAKLNESQIPEIRCRLAAGESTKSIREAFGIRGHSAINAIKKGQTWKHVK